MWFGLQFWLGAYRVKYAFHGIDSVFDVIAELESGNHSFFDENRFACARVAGRAGFARLAGESSKTADFDSVTFDEFLANQVKELFDDGLDVIAHKSGGLGDFLNQRLFCNVRHESKMGLNVSIDDLNISLT